jgi:hypothetical protein
MLYVPLICHRQAYYRARKTAKELRESTMMIKRSFPQTPHERGTHLEAALEVGKASLEVADVRQLRQLFRKN